ncbi:hypothetical protein [Chondromyces apiculatus]|uniref:Secreted protein n=1 Tax=Chondromyces apiculatus DSM 436 TaxID=1192034 RepID=A0A017T2B8_9BACT|nr:hypothetical protein [Chondromyces apiculatus]EYF03112.1 Hypothetical protein CAP_6226 [Chondromyces apiculatus DSM 436]
MGARAMGLRWVAAAGCVGLAGCVGGGGEEVEEGEARDGEVVESDAQALTEGAPLATHDASCLQLTDQNTWSTYAGYMAQVPNARSMAQVLLDLNRVGPVLTASTRPAAVGYKGGFRWNDGDMGTEEWIPQGMTAGVAGGKNVVLTAWHYTQSPDKGVRVSVADISDMAGSAVNYRHVLLVRPSAAGNFTTVPVHGGGLSWFGDYLYMADTGAGMRVFDLTQIREVDDGAGCANAIGKTTVGGATTWCAYGYKYVLPQVSAYVVPASIVKPCRPTFSFLGKDTRGTTPVVLAGEYCNDGDSPCPNGGTAGLGGRLYRWPVDAATNRLKLTGGVAKAEKAYVMNEPNVQGVAPIMTASGTTSYWLSSTRYGGALFKVSTGASRSIYKSGEGRWVRMPQGMHATGSGTNLWTDTEGYNGTTSPASGGRVVVYVDQASVD